MSIRAKLRGLRQFLRFVLVEPLATWRAYIRVARKLDRILRKES